VAARGTHGVNPDAGKDAPIELEWRQIRDGREALRDWLGSGRDGLSVRGSNGLTRVVMFSLCEQSRRHPTLSFSNRARTKRKWKVLE
jgi:hypothetical protein